MKNILFLTGTMVGGGAERVISVLANEFAEKGYVIKIISIYGDSQDYNLDKRINLIPIKCKKRARFLRILERILTIRKIVKTCCPDCVVSFMAEINIHTLIALAGIKTPVIVSERNDPYRNPENVWIRKIRDRIYSRAEGLVFQTPDAKKYFDGIVGKHSNSIIIPNPLTPNLPHHNFTFANKRLITACRLAEQKNLKLMIEAVANVINKGVFCTLDIFGVGPQEKELEEFIRHIHMEKYITLRGFSKDIYKEMSNSAAFLLSSNYEGISNSMIEALAIGLPVIVTDCPIGGARMFIKNNENGILVPVNGCDQLSDAIIEILQNPEKARKMGEKAVKIREELDIQTISRKWIEFIFLIANTREGYL